MSKKIISFFLCMIMLCGTVLSGCSREKTVDEITDSATNTASKNAVTLSMYVVTTDETTPEAQKAVEEAFNAITKAKFKTQVNLHFCTYDEYNSTVDKVIADKVEYNARKKEVEKIVKAAKKAAEKAAAANNQKFDEAAWYDSYYAEHPEYAEFRTDAGANAGNEAEATEKVQVDGADDFFTYQTKYPDEDKYQIDIVWIDSYARFQELLGDNVLADITEYTKDTSTHAGKKLNNYINKQLMDIVGWAGSNTIGTRETYAIPNNHVSGEYTYMLLNKKLIDYYSYDPSTMLSITNTYCQSYLADVIADVADGIIDAYPILGEIPVTNTNCISYDADGKVVDGSSFSLIGGSRTYNSSFALSSGNANPEWGNIFNSINYTNQLIQIQKYKDGGYIQDEKTADPEKDVALRIVKGGIELADLYSDDYYVNIIEYPRFTVEDVFGSMFAVTEFADENISRCVEILTYLNTNSELRNVLQYGVEGTHYTIDEETGLLSRLNRDYIMNIEDTGNVFVAHPEEGISAEAWELAKKQSAETLNDAFCAFIVEDSYLDDSRGPKLNVAQWELINAASAKVAEELAAVKNLDELNTLISKYKNPDDAELKKALEAQSKLTALDNVDAASELSLRTIYYVWANSAGFIK